MTSSARLGLALVAGIAVACVLATMFKAGKPEAIEPMLWADYSRRYIDADGRVIDTGNGGVSHSEGQGYGMLLAVAADDHATFRRLWAWTQARLRVRGDALCAWRWLPNATAPVPDRNNATDGDIYIAWALLRASVIWNEADYRREALAVLADIRARLVRQVAGLSVLLPGVNGFVGETGVVVNLSYWVFPAMTEFADADPDPIWQRLRTDGLQLLDRARFGTRGLPPDWMLLSADGRLQPAPDRPPRFGFDAVRIPLYLAWGRVERPELRQPYSDLLASFGHASVPAWVDLQSDTVAPFGMSGGARALLELADGDRWSLDADTVEMGSDYYAASLGLLGRLALTETSR